MQELSHSQFLDLLRRRSIEVSARGGRLQINAPTGAIDPQLRAELVRRKPDLLGTLQGAAQPSRIAPLIPIQRSGRIPQTPAQQGMWLIDQLTSASVAYNIPVAFLVETPVDVLTLRTAVDRLIARHEILRTYLYEEEGELLQAVSAHIEAPVGFTDLSTVDEEKRAEVLRDLVRKQARLPFDLSCPPLVRFHLFRIYPQQNVIFFNIHHIISDRRSLDILQQELIAFYEATSRGETAVLPELPVQYADYAFWAHRHLAAGAMAGQIQYWKSKLAGAPRCLELPSSHPYPEERTAWGATLLVSISPPVCAGLRGISRRGGATMFMTLLAAFAVLLHRISGQEDFCLGSPFTHRNQVETEPLIGLFVNMLVFRCRMEGNPTFLETLRRTRATALEAYEHSDVPFQELVRALKPDPRSLRSPLFQIMFGFDSDQAPGKSGLISVDTGPGTAKFDLTLQLRESSDGISGWFEYCTDLFGAANIEEMSAQFLTLLEAIVRDPEQPISSLQLTSTVPPIPSGSPEPTATRPGFWSGQIKALSLRLSPRSQKR